MIREACERDLPAILDITNIEIRTDAAHFGTEPLLLDDLRCEIESARGRYPWVVCETNGAVNGFAKAAPRKPRGAYAWMAETACTSRRSTANAALVGRCTRRSFHACAVRTCGRS